MTLFGQSLDNTPRSGVQTPQVDPVRSYCQRLSAVLNLSIESDRQLLQAMQNFRHVCPDKFREVARVHLSFLIDLPHFDDDSASSRKRKVNLHFPSPLRSVKRSCSRSKQQPADSKPAQHHVCQTAVGRMSRLMGHLLENDRYKTEGIFRKTGNCGRQKDLRRQLAQCAECSLAGYTVHDIANVLKQLLRGLDEPLVSDRLLELLTAIADLSSADKCTGRTEPEMQLARCRQQRALGIFSQLLPEGNLALLSSLLHCLHTVAGCQETRMNFDSLGTVFGPALFCHKATEAGSLQKVERLNRICSFLISNCYHLSMIPRSFAEELSRRCDSLLLGAPSKGGGAVSASCLVRFSGGQAAAADSADVPDGDTEAADDYGRRQVAALCAHIRRMPESREKRRLEKRLSHRLMALGATAAASPSGDCQHQLASLQKRLRLRSCSRLPAGGGSPRSDCGGDCDDVKSPQLATSSAGRPRLVRALSSLRMMRRPAPGGGDSPDPRAVRMRSLDDDDHVSEVVDTEAGSSVEQQQQRARLTERPPTPSPARKRLRGRHIGVDISSPRLICCDSAQLKTPPALCSQSTLRSPRFLETAL